MKRILAIVSAFICISAPAHKKQLDHSVYDSWQSISPIVQSEDGNIIAYRINPQEGDSRLIFVNTVSGQEFTVERGGTPTISKDGKWAVFSIKAPFALTRQAKIDKKKADEMPRDSVACLRLSDFDLKKLPDASDLRLSFNSHNVFAYNSGVKDKKVLVVFDPETGRADSLKHVDKFSFSYNGTRLAVVYKKDKKDSLSVDAVTIFSLPSMEKSILSEGKSFYGEPKFNDASDKLLFLASEDSAKTGNKHCAVFLYEELKSGKGKKAVFTTSIKEIVPQTYSDGKLCVTENSNPRFSRLSNRIFLGISECLPPDDTTLVSFETASLDIWNYDIYMTPPIQKAQLSRLKKATYDAVINLAVDPGRIVRIGESLFDVTTLIDGGEADWAVVSNSDKYQIRSSWDSNEMFDLYKVSLLDGSRTPIFTSEDGMGSVSPEGKYFVWYSNVDRNWHSYRFSDGACFNLTENVDGIFWDDEDDHPMPSPSYDRPHWIEGDDAFLLADKYDVFRFSPDGKKVTNMTEGKGRQNNIQYRYINIVKSDISPALSELGVKKAIGKKETVHLTAFDRTGKKNGIARINAANPGLISSFVDTFTYSSISKASETIAYLKGNFNNPNDIYYTKDFFNTETKLSSINPQQGDYNWGNVQLVHWTAYDGTKLDGLLFTPEDLDPDKKYPMMVYFYEKYSETLYNYRSPSPSRSTVNTPFFVSRGYVYFIPDVVYTPGHPGESAYNCICSGAEAMCRQFGFIDPARMAIQGQSWGGYQVAYLVTRTNMFAAAGAGAPVGNMTSAYGGIRWESGRVRAMQYEHGQSRIGASLWDEGGLDLYIENSPIFHTQNVTTPTLIMHNDNDGAVPWYQGIEFFMALRRFGHPAWLLEYNNEAHNLVERKNTKDLSIRLQQFFDHYLLGAPMPAWMKTGVPITRKGQYFGFEDAEE